jgi:hypothetical protein
LQEAWALNYTARAQRTLGDLTSAMAAAQRAAELFEQAGDCRRRMPDMDTAR